MIVRRKRLGWKGNTQNVRRRFTSRSQENTEEPADAVVQGEEGKTFKMGGKMNPIERSFLEGLFVGALKEWQKSQLSLWAKKYLSLGSGPSPLVNEATGLHHMLQILAGKIGQTGVTTASIFSLPQTESFTGEDVTVFTVNGPIVVQAKRGKPQSNVSLFELNDVSKNNQHLTLLAREMWGEAVRYLLMAPLTRDQLLAQLVDPWDCALTPKPSDIPRVPDLSGPFSLIVDVVNRTMHSVQGKFQSQPVSIDQFDNPFDLFRVNTSYGPEVEITDSVAPTLPLVENQLPEIFQPKPRPEKNILSQIGKNVLNNVKGLLKSKEAGILLPLGIGIALGVVIRMHDEQMEGLENR